MAPKRVRRVTVTELSSMGKCESMTKLKAIHGERAHQSVMDAAERGRREHVVFERQGDRRCFVASWALGPDHWATWELRLFRDQFLSRFFAGRAFVALYYALSPGLVKFLSLTPGVQGVCAKSLKSVAGWIKRRRESREK